MFYGHTNPCLANFIQFLNSSDLPDFKNKVISIFSFLCNTIVSIHNPKEKHQTVFMQKTKEKALSKPKPRGEKDYYSHTLILSMIVLVRKLSFSKVFISVGPRFAKPWNFLKESTDFDREMY